MSELQAEISAAVEHWAPIYHEAGIRPLDLKLACRALAAGVVSRRGTTDQIRAALDYGEQCAERWLAGLD